MAIQLINDTQKNFVVVNKAVAMDKQLGLKERGLMLTLMSLPPKWNFSVRGLASILPDGVDSIRKSVNILESKKYISREQVRNAYGRYEDTIITIHPDPAHLPVAEKPCTEKPITVNPITDESSTEIPTEINNEQISNKEIKNKESINHSDSAYMQTVEQIKRQIDYEYIRIDRKNDIKLLNLIVNLIATTLLSKAPTIKIAGVDIESDVVKGKLCSLDMYMIEFVIDRVKEVEKTITNINGYILTCLFNSEEQEDLYYSKLASELCASQRDK